MFEIGPLTSFTPPAHCSTPLLKCTSGLGCAPTAGLTCGPGGIPTSAAECYPGGSAFMTQSYARYMPGEACPGNYAPATTTTYTTSTVTVSPTYGFTYFRATDVVCCPLGFSYAGYVGCKSVIPSTSPVYFSCDLDTTVSVTLSSFNTDFRYGIITGTGSATTRVDNTAQARALTYISGVVGSGPWPTSTSATRRYASTGSGSSSSSSSDIEGGKVRAKTVRIAVGVAVPVFTVILAVFVACCRRKVKNKDREMMAAPPIPVLTQNTGLVTPAPDSSQVLANFFGRQTHSSPPQTHLPPPYLAGSEAVHERPSGQAMVGQTGGADERTRHLSVLETEQMRIQAEIQRLRNGS